MKTTTTKVGAEAKPRSRYTELKQMLEDRRREIQVEVQGKIRDVRAEGTWGGKQSEVFDAVESSEADIQDEIEFALIHMKSETLNKINDALKRLDTAKQRLFEDQQRVRANLGEVPQGSDLHGRYLAKLGQQEDELDRIATEIATTGDAIAAAEAALADAITKLEVP